MMDTSDIREEPFPAPSKQASGTVNGIATEVCSTNFEDKIMLTISQDGRLSQWIQVPLSAPSPALVDMAMPRAELSALPSLHLTPKTLLGGGGPERETLGQLYAAQIASHLALRNPEDRRTLVLGLGLRKFDAESRDAFFDVLELIIKAL
ncbi:Proteasome assembly chaperone 3 [Cytospora mali]|uniref:Proteasome assembly chaperone 3 n=1 Tax=Cytospora mali TaxID=578113 RepID=A0A194ULX2_CYTMA|nr:Proteasome assembly chaperone 3 [Valsa mali var. pyri (nom. inval.)]